eukprot:jgi/Psemu1/9127/gm1.9127_g
MVHNNGTEQWDRMTEPKNRTEQNNRMQIKTEDPSAKTSVNKQLGSGDDLRDDNDDDNNDPRDEKDNPGVDNNDLRDHDGILRDDDPPLSFL